MKPLFLLFFFSYFSYAQINIKGTVLSPDNTPLEGAAVYLNNTSIATFTDWKGSFKLYIEKGKHLLIVSYLGHKTIHEEILIDDQNTIQNLEFRLEEEDDTLDEIIINSKDNNSNTGNTLKLVKSKRSRYSDFQKFRTGFLGRSTFANRCKIVNREALSYYYTPQTDHFIVTAKEPIVVINNDLGYKIHYDLIKYEQKKLIIGYVGYSRYEELEGGKRSKKRWERNRLIAYNGSVMHFLRSLVRVNTKEEGFDMDLMFRIPNINYPTEKELRFAKKLFRDLERYNVPIDYNKTIIIPETRIDSAILIHRRELKHKKIIDTIIRKDIRYSDVTYRLSGKAFMNFNGLLKVTYNNEKEEFEYKNDQKVWSGKQVSKFILINTPQEILPIGQLSDPTNHLVEGYWSYEKFAVALPLNYIPPEKPKIVAN
ncbi:carboxypeptidase-like regulatory domain-containing protein [Tenacibaculum jejuense]|uniref:Carboxypeptidase-like regulatory domain-containing protein n=1 Tax=Tenacibaculum jejuense TaxID=584609 RepID=A0A238UD98_9FLAO|nr:carboxypeptidase-like regulatory domain-containing protein [Tenacibaculum jejuense]SNR17141.1 Protein of unknown function [Tenacibaculum jejuense]